MSDEQTRVLVDRIARDCRTVWLTTNIAQQRMKVTAELLNEANTALDLADTRYGLGLSSIVELSISSYMVDSSRKKTGDVARERIESGTAYGF